MTVTIQPVLNMIRTNFYGGRIIEDNEPKTLVAHCNPYYMQVNPKSKNQPEWFAKKIQLEWFSRTDLHMVRLTVVDKLLIWCVASTAPTVSDAYKVSHREQQWSYNRWREKYLFTVKLTLWKSIRDKRFDLNFWGKIFASKFSPRINFHTVRLTVFDNMLTWSVASTATAVALFMRAVT